MKLSFWRFLFISMALHGVLLASLFWIKKSSPKKETITVEYKTQTPILLPPVKIANRAKNKTVKANPPSTSKQTPNSGSALDKFKPKLDFSVSSTSGPNVDQSLLGNGDTFDVSPNTDNPNASWGSGSASFGRVRDYMLYKKVYDSVDGSLFFPSFFVRRNIQGVTNARLVLNAQGTCDWDKTRIYGNDTFMQIYILSVLKKACSQSFKSFIKERIVTNIDLSFQFAITEATTGAQTDENKFIVGNSLMFYRNSYKSVMQWEFGPFQGIFPVPAVYLNLPWIQENWETIMNNKDPISEFKKEFGG